jgi:hypothetical protein
VDGEWIGYSQENHPDFLWLPIRHRGGNPNVRYAQVEHLLDLSISDDAGRDIGSLSGWSLEAEP